MNTNKMGSLIFLPNLRNTSGDPKSRGFCIPYKLRYFWYPYRTPVVMPFYVYLRYIVFQRGILCLDDGLWRHSFQESKEQNRYWSPHLGRLTHLIKYTAMKCTVLIEAFIPVRNIMKCLLVYFGWCHYQMKKSCSWSDVSSQGLLISLSTS